MKTHKRSKRHHLRGAATAEFAICAPILFMLVFAGIECTRAVERLTMLEMAAREGARTASMDREGLTSGGQTTNEKVTQDILAYLEGQGFDTSSVTIAIADDEDENVPFDLDDEANENELFQIRVVGAFDGLTPWVSDMTLTGRTVFRNGRSNIAN